MIDKMLWHVNDHCPFISGTLMSYSNDDLAFDSEQIIGLIESENLKDADIPEMMFDDSSGNNSLTHRVEIVLLWQRTRIKRFTPRLSHLWDNYEVRRWESCEENGDLLRQNKGQWLMLTASKKGELIWLLSLYSEYNVNFVPPQPLTDCFTYKPSALSDKQVGFCSLLYMKKCFVSYGFASYKLQIFFILLLLELFNYKNTHFLLMPKRQFCTKLEKVNDLVIFWSICVALNLSYRK